MKQTAEDLSIRKRRLCSLERRHLEVHGNRDGLQIWPFLRHGLEQKLNEAGQFIGQTCQLDKIYLGPIYRPTAVKALINCHIIIIIIIIIIRIRIILNNVIIIISIIKIIIINPRMMVLGPI